ncbi:MAG: hypothetical protein ACJAR8_001283 [Bacteroidia bacterium]|jgi:hypothetical protein
MKNKYLLIIIMVFGSLRASSQITLEHTYTVAESQTQLGIINLSSSGYKYILAGTNANSQVKLYNLDHSLWKTINVPALSGFTLQFAGNISEGLFDVNKEIEYVAQYYNLSTNPVQWHFKVLNENGKVIKDLPNRAYQRVIATASNTFKLIVTDVNFIREVYSLPGKYNTLRVPDTDEVGTLGNSFPNPATERIIIPYNLDNSISTGLINIYDNTGRLVKSLTIDNSFNNIELDLSTYSSGLYYYNITIDGTKSISKSFLKK